MSDPLWWHELQHARFLVLHYLPGFVKHDLHTEKFIKIYPMLYHNIDKAAQENFWMHPGSFPTNISVTVWCSITIAQWSLNGYATESTECTKSPMCMRIHFHPCDSWRCIWFLEFKWSVEPWPQQNKKCWLFFSDS